MLLFDVLVVYTGPDPQQFGGRFLENILIGYRRQNPIDPSWVGRLPLFLKLVEIGVYRMLAAAYDPATADEWVGKFMPGRREKIEQGLAYVELDFMDIASRAGI